MFLLHTIAWNNGSSEILIQVIIIRPFVQIQQNRDMGNCTPRSRTNVNAPTQNNTNGTQAQVKVGSSSNTPAPQHIGTERQSREFSANQLLLQKVSSQNKSYSSQKKIEKGEVVDPENNPNDPKNASNIKTTETLATLVDEKKDDLRGSNSAKTESQISKRNVPLNIQEPSQIRESLASNWNKSNFNQSQFFQSGNFNKVFRKNTIRSTGHN